MDIKKQIESDLKTAMLSGDRQTTTSLRGIKSAILNVEITKGVRDTGLSDDEIIEVLSKEAKKRQESADLYEQGGNAEMANAELKEKGLIEQYLPAQLADEELGQIIDKTIAELNAEGMQAMGQVIGSVKQQTAGQADGGRIAQMVKERLVQ